MTKLPPIWKATDHCNIERFNHGVHNDVLDGYGKLEYGEERSHDSLNDVTSLE